MLKAARAARQAHLQNVAAEFVLTGQKMTRGIAISPRQLVIESFENLADLDIDPASRIAERFFATYPEAAAKFGSDPYDYEKHQMMSKIIRLILTVAEGSIDLENSAYWVADHQDYKIDRTMIEDLFQCVVETIRDLLGDRWTMTTTRAWNEITADLSNLAAEALFNAP